MENPNITSKELLETLLLFDETVRTLSMEIIMLAEEGGVKMKQCMMCGSKKSVVDDMYNMNGHIVCEDCAFHLCEKDYAVKVQNIKLYFDSDGDLIGNSLSLDIADVIKSTFKKHKVNYKLIVPSKKDLEY